MARITVPLDPGNRSMRNGGIATAIQRVMDRWKPEAAYFASIEGKRGMYIVFDLADPSDIPVFAEPLFMELNADVEVVPVMNAEDLQRGISQLR
jgi:hypothetical protein